MLILASSSPTRKALLQQAGLRFAIRPPAIDERAIEAAALGKSADPSDIAMLLADAKARSVSQREPLATVIGADQVLATEQNELLHKPATLAAARAQLKTLRGKTHRLHAGVALARGDAMLWSHVETAELTMRDFSDEELDAVMAQEGEALLSSVGGYRLEGPSIRLFQTIIGDYFAILGLPLLPLLAALRRHAPETPRAAA